jgi:hypothetical protein
MTPRAATSAKKSTASAFSTSGDPPGKTSGERLEKPSRLRQKPGSPANKPTPATRSAPVRAADHVRVRVMHRRTRVTSDHID